ncbi:hypothetical protein ACFLYP_02550, partial [Chloroflexota bacterium]
EATQGETFEVIGQNKEGTWLVIQVGAGVRGWILAEDVQINVTGFTFEFVITPIPPPTDVYVTIKNNSSTRITIKFIPEAVQPIKIFSYQSITVKVPIGQYQILIIKYHSPSKPPVCQSSAYINKSIIIGGTSLEEICASLP